MAYRNMVETTLVAGKVTAIDENTRSFTVQTRGGDVLNAFTGPETIYSVLTNVDGEPRDRTVDPPDEVPDDLVRKIRRYLATGALVFVRGNNFESEGRQRFDARWVGLLQAQPGDKYMFEETHWWISQISLLADRWLDNMFAGERDYSSEDWARAYRTQRNIVGGQMDDTVQECATLSRLIYGLSSAYLLTGSERYFLAAKGAVAYQRQAFRTMSHDGQHCFWAHARRSGVAGEKLIMTSQFDDDRNAIPMYEQIYALAGLAQYYRITGDWEVLADIRTTLNTFFNFYRDDLEAKSKGFPGLGGYFSHLDPVTLRPDTPALGHNQARKNWNSVGDHIPAYLVNLVLSLDPLPHGAGRAEFDRLQDRAIEILDETVTLILDKFPDENNDYVNEKFYADWTPDHEWRWQQNRAVCGHDLKIAWNLTRCGFYLKHRVQRLRARGQGEEADQVQNLANRCDHLARKLGDKMAERGVDAFRGGIFDVVERNPMNGMPVEFTWEPTKDFWQQEQGILAYLILHGSTGEERYLELARESAAFWNFFFLDRDNQGIFFRTNVNGRPLIEGEHGRKGGHSVSGYHAFELAYLAHLYTRAYVERDKDDRSFSLYFKVLNSREQETINVLPDFMPPGRVNIDRIEANGVDRTSDLKPESPDMFQIPVEDIAPSPRDESINLMVRFSVH
jgi:hypothetical protein